MRARPLPGAFTAVGHVTHTPAVTRRLTWTALFIISLAGAFFRLYDIQKAGIVFEDESWYASDARLWHRCMKTMTDTDAWSALLAADKSQFQARLAANGVHWEDRYNKPSQGYTMLAALMMFPVGDSPTALLVTNAVCGVVSIYVLYWIGVLQFGRGAALVAALLLALSPYHIIYCRSALAESSATLFVLVGIAIWAAGTQARRNWKRANAWSGLCFGFAILCHYRSAYIPALLIAFDALFVRIEPLANHVGQDTPSRPRRALLLAAFVAVPLAGMELLFQGAHFAASMTDSYLPLDGYIYSMIHYAQLLQERVGVESGGVWNPGVLAKLAGFYQHWLGAPALVLAIIGACCVLFRPGAARWSGAFVTASLAILTLQRYSVARSLAVLIPFVCLCTAFLLVQLVSRLRLSSRTSAIVVFVIAGTIAWPGVVHACSLLKRRSAFPVAVHWLARAGGLAMLPPDTKKYSLYHDNSTANLKSLNATREAHQPRIVLQQLRDEGVRWVVTDAQHWHCCDPGKHWHASYEWWEVMRVELEKNAHLAAEFQHLASFEWEFLAEGWGPDCMSGMIATNGGRLRIFDIQSREGGSERAPGSVVRLSQGPP